MFFLLLLNAGDRLVGRKFFGTLPLIPYFCSMNKLPNFHSSEKYRSLSMALMVVVGANYCFSRESFQTSVGYFDAIRVSSHLRTTHLVSGLLRGDVFDSWELLLHHILNI